MSEDNPTLEKDVIQDFAAWRESMGLRPIKTREVSNKRVRSFSLSDEAYEGLKLWASQFKGKASYGGLLSVSALIESIGLYELMVIDPNSLKKEAVKAEAKTEEAETEESEETMR